MNVAQDQWRSRFIFMLICAICYNECAVVHCGAARIIRMPQNAGKFCTTYHKQTCACLQQSLPY